MKTGIILLICIIMAVCSNNRGGSIPGKELAGRSADESLGDNLVGKLVMNLSDFKLYDQPEGVVVEELYPARNYCGRVKERKGDWIRFGEIRAITKLAVPFSGWTKWNDNDSVRFEIMKEQ